MSVITGGNDFSFGPCVRSNPNSEEPKKTISTGFGFGSTLSGSNPNSEEPKDLAQQQQQNFQSNPFRLQNKNSGQFQVNKLQQKPL